MCYFPRALPCVDYDIPSDQEASASLVDIDSTMFTLSLSLSLLACSILGHHHGLNIIITLCFFLQRRSFTYLIIIIPATPFGPKQILHPPSI